MSIITISRGSYCRGKEIAEKVAEKLGYECISRDILLEASNRLRIPEIKLVRALHDAPSILDRFTGGKEKFISDIKSILLNHLKRDNIVYHGLAGHFFLRGLPHVLKVRILADFEQRVQDEAKRENISEEKARRLLKKDDEERRRWSLNLYGMDTWDPNLYDMVFNIGTLTVDCVVDNIVATVQQPQFQTTDAYQKKLEDYALKAELEARLNDFPLESVEAVEGNALVRLKTSLLSRRSLRQKIETIATNIPNVSSIDIQFESKST